MARKQAMKAQGQPNPQRPHREAGGHGSPHQRGGRQRIGGQRGHSPRTHRRRTSCHAGGRPSHAVRKGSPAREGSACSGEATLRNGRSVRTGPYVQESGGQSAHPTGERGEPGRVGSREGERTMRPRLFARFRGPIPGLRRRPRAHGRCRRAREQLLPGRISPVRDLSGWRCGRGGGRRSGRRSFSHRSFAAVLRLDAM